jgi:hypothetical protein
MVYVETVHERTTRPCLTFGWDLTEWPYSRSRLEAKANERPAQLKRCSNTIIRLNIELRCARRRNGAAYQNYRRRSVTGGHAIILHPRHMERTNALGARAYALDCKSAAESWSDRASFPGKRGRSPWRFVRATGCDAHAGTQEFRRLRQHRATPFPPNWPFRIQIWTEGVLVEHPALLVGRCNPALVNLK